MGHEGHNYLGQKKFFNAIEKYGWNNFSHEILFINLSKDKALKIEAELINKYDCVKNGYNSPTKYPNELYSKEIYCVETGEVFPSVASAARIYNRASSTLSHHLHGDKRLAYGKHWYFTDDELNEEHYKADYEYEQKLLQIEEEEQKLIKMYNNGLTIRQINEQTHISREKISNILKKNNISFRTNLITAIALDKETLQPIKEFPNLFEACKWCGMNGRKETARITTAIKESWRICGGYKWTTTNEELLKIREEKEKEYKENHVSEQDMVNDYLKGMTTLDLENKYGYCRATISKILHKNGVQTAPGGKQGIVQIDKDTKKIVQIFSSIKEAYHNIGLQSHNPTLRKRCQDHKEYHGYIWYFEEDYFSLTIEGNCGIIKKKEDINGIK